MGASWRAIRPCQRCREPFEPTRQRQTACLPCRRRLALERHAAKRMDELLQIEAALTAALGTVWAEFGRWRNITAGSPRKRGEWRRSRSRFIERPERRKV